MKQFYVSLILITVFLIPGIRYYCVGQDDFKITKILKEAKINSTDSTIKKSISLHANEMYVSYNIPNARLIEYHKTEYLIPFKSGSESLYEKKEVSPSSNHTKGEWNQSHIKKRMKGGIECFRIDATWLREIDTTVIKIYNYFGEPITVLSDNTHAVDFLKDDLNGNNMIRVVISGQLTRLYSIPKNDIIPIDKDYYEIISDVNNVELYWEKDNGYLYKAVPPGNLEFERKLLPNQTDTILLQDRQKAMLITKGQAGKEIDLPKQENFLDKIMNFIKQIIMLIAIILISIVFLFTIIFFRKRIVKFLSPFIKVFLPYEKHIIQNKDTLESLSEKYETTIIELKEANSFDNKPSNKPVSQIKYLVHQGFTVGEKINIPRISKKQNKTNSSLESDIISSDDQSSVTILSNKDSYKQEPTRTEIKEKKSIETDYRRGLSDDQKKLFRAITSNIDSGHNKIAEQIHGLEHNYYSLRDDIDSISKQLQSNYENELNKLTENNETLNSEKEELAKQNSELTNENNEIKNKVFILSFNDHLLKISKQYSETYDELGKIKGGIQRQIENTQLDDNSRLIVYQMLENRNKKDSSNSLSGMEWQYISQRSILINPEQVRLLNVAVRTNPEPLKNSLMKSIIGYAISSYIWLEELSKLGRISGAPNYAIEKIESFAKNNKEDLINLMKSHLKVFMDEVELFESRKKSKSNSLKDDDERGISTYLRNVNGLKKDDIQELYSVGILKVNDPDINDLGNKKISYFRAYN